MTRREQLHENYEDALFALLMYEIAEEEGAELLAENERLKDDPSAEVPEQTDRLCRKAIDRAFAKQRRSAAIHITGKVINKIAIVALISVMLFVSAYAAIPEVRIGTLNMLIETSNVATRLPLSSEGGDSVAAPAAPSDGGLLLGYRLPAVPDGFSVADSGGTSHSAWIEYSDGGDETIYISIKLGSSLNVDTENAETEEIQVQGHDALLVEKDDHISVVWGDADTGYFVELICANLDESMVRSLAGEIIFAGE